jgi:pimeloyl-ACP methyl ester carboxylesterase
MSVAEQEGGVMTTDQKVHIAYDDLDAGDPAVVLLHGLFGNRTYYAAQAHHLAAGHRVLNIDLRGHGESEVPDEATASMCLPTT